jgi:hypothetical protein
MSLPLAPNVHLAVLGEDVVLLDVAADVYLCVPGGRDSLRPCEGRRTLSPLDGEARSAVLEADLVAATPSIEPGPVPPAMPRCEIATGPGDRMTAWEAVQLIAALWDLFVHYRGRRFDQILARARRGAPAAQVRDPAETHRLARVFRRAAVWLPMSRKCLVRSFVLLRFLQRCGHDARWVFGVRTWPFAAHCWLQLGDTALDDTLERLCAYQPILSVG